MIRRFIRWLRDRRCSHPEEKLTKVSLGVGRRREFYRCECGETVHDP